MLTEVDRLLVATPDAAAAAAAWRSVLGAEEVHSGPAPALGAYRTVVRAGRSDVEFLQPDGTGAIADALSRRGRAHVWAAGAASPDPGAVAGTARAAGARVGSEGDRVHVELEIEGAPIRFVISPEAERAPAGRLDFLYEATVLAADQAGAVARIRDAFGLDESVFTTITSEMFGYTGVLTLFRAGQLHRFEVITPIDRDKTMGRYHAREGACFYMGFAEASDLLDVERQIRPGGVTIDRPEGRRADQAPDQVWIHPPTLGGVMLGVSRPSMAWMWSGHPERVLPV
jgi:catechol 2,3-dioxygenase-like lactoylglutathione lyase family enzyme